MRGAQPLSNLDVVYVALSFLPLEVAGRGRRSEGTEGLPESPTAPGGAGPGGPASLPLHIPTGILVPGSWCLCGPLSLSFSCCLPTPTSDPWGPAVTPTPCDNEEAEAYEVHRLPKFTSVINDNSRIQSHTCLTLEPKFLPSKLTDPSIYLA